MSRRRMIGLGLVALIGLGLFVGRGVTGRAAGGDPLAEGCGGELPENADAGALGTAEQAILANNPLPVVIPPPTGPVTAKEVLHLSLHLSDTEIGDNKGHPVSKVEGLRCSNLLGRFTPVDKWIVHGEVKGAAFLNEDTSNLIVVFKGTNFGDVADALADLDIGLTEALGFLLHLVTPVLQTTTMISNALDVDLGFWSAGVPDTSPNIDQKIAGAEAYINELQSDFPLVRRKYIVGGHSLGGFVAQVIAWREGFRGITFNAPGAKTYLELSSREASTADVVNHRREHDVVGRFGTVIGSVETYPDHYKVVKRATFHRHYPCGSGKFFDPREGGECWSCPAGYTRTAYPVTHDKACTDCLGCVLKEKLHSATFQYPSGCPTGTFFDPRNAGECWSCPSGFDRGITPVTSDNACFRLPSLTGVKQNHDSDRLYKDHFR